MDLIQLSLDEIFCLDGICSGFDSTQTVTLLPWDITILCYVLSCCGFLRFSVSVAYKDRRAGFDYGMVEGVARDAGEVWVVRTSPILPWGGWVGLAWPSPIFGASSSLTVASCPPSCRDVVVCRSSEVLDHGFISWSALVCGYGT